MKVYFLRNASFWKTGRHKAKIRRVVVEDFCQQARKQIEAAVKSGLFEASPLDVQSCKTFEEYLADVFMSYTEGVGFHSTKKAQIKEAQQKILMAVQLAGRLYREKGEWENQLEVLGECAFIAMTETGATSRKAVSVCCPPAAESR